MARQHLLSDQHCPHVFTFAGIHGLRDRVILNALIHAALQVGFVRVDRLDFNANRFDRPSKDDVDTVSRQ